MHAHVFLRAPTILAETEYGTEMLRRNVNRGQHDGFFDLADFLRIG